VGASAFAAGWVLLNGFGAFFGQVSSRAFHAARGVAAVARTMAESLARVTLAGVRFLKSFD